MKVIFRILLFIFLLSSFISIEAAAQEISVYGFSGIVYDSVNGRVKGTSYTELDYSTEAYYSPYVCGELFVSGVSQVRACQGGIHRATSLTSFAGAPSSTYLLSDHYVDAIFEDDPGTSYIDYYGYSFLFPATYPTSYFFPAPETYTNVQLQSIRLGSTDVTAQKPTITIENNYTFSPNPVAKINGSTDLTVTITASGSAVFTGGAKADVNLIVVTPGFDLALDPATQIKTVTLIPSGAATAMFNIKTTTGNTKSGDLIFRILILEVRDKNNAVIPNANINVNPSGGLLTDDTMRKLVVSP